MVHLCVSFVLLNFSMTDGLTVGLFYLLETDRHQFGNSRLYISSKSFFSLSLFIKIKSGYALSSDRVSALSTPSSRQISWQNLAGYWSLDLLSFCVAAKGPGDKETHGSVHLHTETGCYVTGGCLWLGNTGSERRHFSLCGAPPALRISPPVLAFSPDGNTLMNRG